MSAIRMEITEGTRVQGTRGTFQSDIFLLRTEWTRKNLELNTVIQMT